MIIFATDVQNIDFEREVTETSSDTDPEFNVEFKDNAFKSDFISIGFPTDSLNVHFRRNFEMAVSQFIKLVQGHLLGPPVRG